ncbi:MAG: stage II sporulation protein M [Prevotella histicola]|jgi:integral membrane protein|nr:stage II sporulation protein M [Prevotella histicola]MBF1422539.1 stage II sporulation protein M [Prevotella histicola]MBW4739525.1 stage II sporulation protein M [Prevotella histicola]MBW4747820.1 stage II sporulation protein M [Prevotella histicola]
MKEILFIRNNIDKWRSVEELIDNVNFEMPDRLAEAYIDLTADLAFAQTHYPHSRITIYLNNLSSSLHNELYRNKREKWSRVLTFWTQEVPDVMWKERRLLLISFLIFMVSVLIGVLSTLGDASFPRLILGDGYMDMTLENIAKGKPMGVYGSEEESVMFLGITLNNIMVSFNIFVSGVLTSFMPGYQLFQNGIMVGCFDTFFYQHGLLGESLLATMLHGTLELSAIVVAGAAGLAMGNGWLFPGTYSRIVSFQRGAKRGMKIVVGTVPLFILAGFIESFITRHTEINDFVRLTVILLSLCFVIFYFIYLPYKRNHYKHASRKT